MSQKTLRNFQIAGAIYSGVGAGAQEAQAGDEVRLFLNQTANPGFPEYINGIIQPPVSAVNVIDSGGHVVEGRSYSFSYESDDLDGAAEYLTACDIIEVSVTTCCVALREALDAEIAARAAADTALAADIDEVQEDLDGWDVLAEEPTNGVAGVPQVATQTVVGTIATAGVIEVTVTGADIVDSPITLEVDVDAGDVPSVTAAKIVGRILLNENITALYDAASIGPDFALTEKVPNGNDGTLNIAIDNGSATGLTPDASSTNTVIGIAEVVGTVPSHVGQHAHVGDRIWEATDISPATWVEITTEKNSPMMSPVYEGLTGGASENLDSLVVTEEDLGRMQIVAEIDNNGHYLHVLETGTDAEAAPHIVRPDNFHLTDNPVVWKWKPAFTDSASVRDASTGGNGAADSGKVVKFDGDGSFVHSNYIQVRFIGSSNVAAFSAALGLTADRTYDVPDFSGAMALDVSVVPATPTTGFTITASAKLDQTHYLTPAGTLATGTFNLPTAANSRAGQVVRVHSTEEVTAVTVAVSGGGTINGAAVTQFVADTTYAFQCVSTAGSGTWIRLQ